MGNFNESMKMSEVRENVAEKEAEEKRLWNNYTKNLLVQKEIKTIEEEFARGEISQEELNVRLSGCKRIEIHLTPEEQWQTINEIFAMKDISDFFLRNWQKRRIALRDYAADARIGYWESQESLRRIEDILGKEHESENADRNIIPTSCPDYIKEIEEADEIFDYEKCIEADIQAEVFIRTRLTLEEKMKALTEARLFETTRERILKELDKDKGLSSEGEKQQLPDEITALREEAKRQRASHVDKKGEKQSLMKRLARIFGRGEDR